MIWEGGIPSEGREALLAEPISMGPWDSSPKNWGDRAFRALRV